MTILYRHASPEDAWAITEVNVATWRSAYRDIFPADFLANRSIPERSAQLEEYLYHLGPDVAFFVAVQVPDGIVGYVTGDPRGTYRPRATTASWGQFTFWTRGSDK